MHTPTSKQVQTVIDNLKKVLPLATQKKHLDMMQPNINYMHNCGTVHCHGGWYAVAIIDWKQPMNYLDGANLMANHLGFYSYELLYNWADMNADVWGNSRGLAMFSEGKAFMSEKRPDGAKNLQHIINHWEEVRDRIIAIENEKK